MLLKINSKKAISVMIGYVILIALAVIMGGGVYLWVKTFVPSENLICPEDVSVFIKDSYFNSTYSSLNLTIKNNGKFNIGGYFAHISNDSSQELETIDISPYLNESYSGYTLGNSIVASMQGGNSFETSQEVKNVFDIPSEFGTPYSIKITPIRFQEEKNRERLVSCSNSQIIQLINLN